MRAILVLIAAFATACASAPRGAAPAAVATPEPVAAPTPAPSPTPTDTEYHVGSGDVLDVTVFGSPDLSRNAMVQNDGTITLPLLLEVPVGGLTVKEIEAKVTQLLGEKYLVNPQVDVQVREYNSQFVTVLGEVNQPGRRPLRGGTRLIDVLLDAGGLRTGASGDVVVTRPSGFPSGEKTVHARLNPGGLGAAQQEMLGLLLQPGDIVTAQPKFFVIVQGEVTRPSRYAIENDLTVTGVVSLAGGLTRFGSNKVQVLRTKPDGRQEKLEADLKAIREGRERDLPLEPNDIVTVPRRFL